MSDFSELCPLFNTGVYNELYLGKITTTLYAAASMNFLGGAADVDTGTMSFNLGRTVVVTNLFLRRLAFTVTDTCCIFIGRQTDTGSAAPTIFGTHILLSAVTAYPDFAGKWQPIDAITSFTVHTADYLFIGALVGDTQLDLIVQYREK